MFEITEDFGAFKGVDSYTLEPIRNKESSMFTDTVNVDALEYREECDYYKWNGYTEKFDKYIPIVFNIDPFVADTRQMQEAGWRMSVKQKTYESRMYLNFTNKKNFGFRVRLPPKVYRSFTDIFVALDHYVSDVEFSQVSELNIRVVKTIEYMDREVIKNVIINRVSSFEEVMQNERERIMNVIGDYRGEVVELPDNVIDLSEYLKEPKKIESSEVFFNELLQKIG